MKIPRFKINIPKISVPSMPKFRLPAFKLPKFKWWTRFLNKTKTAFDFILPYAIGLGNGILYILTFLTVVTGALLLTITLANPVNLWWSMSPIETPYFVIGYSQVITYIEFIQSYYWESVGIGVGLILFGYIIHIRSIKAFYEGIKASPRSILYSPITFYNELKNFRDWLFKKIEYLNGESEKWRRFFNIMKSPYSLLRSLGLNPQMAIAVLGIGSTTAVGVGVAEVMEIRSFENRSPGIYAAPSEYPDEELEKEMAWRKDNVNDNTLRIVMGSVPVEEITISNVSVGTVYTGSALPSGKAEAILIEGKSGMSARLEIGELIFERNTCKSLTLSDINAYKVVVQYNISDGQSIAQTIGTSRDLRISGGNRMAKKLSTEGGLYDRIWLDTGSLTSTNAKINKLNLSNIVSKGGTCILRQLDVGLLTIQYNQTGHDQNFATKEFDVQSSTTASIWSVIDNREVLLQEPDTQ